MSDADDDTEGDEWLAMMNFRVAVRLLHIIRHITSAIVLGLERKSTGGRPDGVELKWICDGGGDTESRRTVTGVENGNGWWLIDSYSPRFPWPHVI